MIVKLSLALVVLVDVMGQGLFLPILTTLLLEPNQPFLPESTSQSARNFYFGLITAAFFFSWFLGAAYISKLSDMIGRKRGIQICLVGGLVGYGLIIVSLFTNSFWLLLLGRIVTGFTAGNQPIAQAAMIDLSATAQDRTRNLGLIVAAASIGLVAGPIIGGVLSDSSLIGEHASLKLPFFVAAGLIAATIALIALFFHDSRQDRQKFTFKPWEIFLVLWRALQRPAILRISAVFFCFMFVLNTLFVFMDNYLATRFGFGTFKNAMAMMTFGLVVGIASTVLPSLADRYTTKRRTVLAALAVYIAALLGFVLAPTGGLAFLPIAVFALAFAVGYPTLLSIFSLSVDETEQGWIMGVTTALFTLAAGLTSLIGGEAMALNPRLPFLYAMGVAGLAMVLLVATWGYPAVKRISHQHHPPLHPSPTARSLQEACTNREITTGVRLLGNPVG
ncbi:MAG: MFS transporter, partial [Pseudomonadota bacterium]